MSVGALKLYGFDITVRAAVLNKWGGPASGLRNFLITLNYRPILVVKFFFAFKVGRHLPNVENHCVLKGFL